MNRLTPSPSVRDLLKSGQEDLFDLSGRSRRIAGILSPLTVEDVVRIVRWANETHGVRLHAVSCGKNWGFGSALPTEQDAYIVDLSGLKNIRNLDLSAGFAELEPGVTQGMLDKALEAGHRTHYFNVTGAGTETSVLGNALERGIGYFGSRHEDLLDLEVVLPTGEIIHTSCHSGMPFHTGLGIDLKDLFVQSSLGIVTSAKVRLPRRPEVMGVLLAKPLPSIPVGKLVEALATCQAEGLIRSVPHIANKQRAYITFAPYLRPEERSAFTATLSDWSAVIPLFGPKPLVEAATESIIDRLKNIASCQFLASEGAPADGALKPLTDLAQGIPSNVALPGVSFAALGQVEPIGLNLEKGMAGLIHVVPTCLPEEVSVRSLLNLIEETRLGKKSEPLALTINLVNVGMAVVVISVPLIRTREEDKLQSVDLADTLLLNCHERGFTPYRLGLNDAETLAALSRRPTEKDELLQRMVELFDPNGILCRSRYQRVDEPVDDTVETPHLSADLRPETEMVAV